MNDLDDIFAQKDALIKRLMKALEHLDRDRQYTILCSWMSTKELKELVEFQERE